MNSIENSFSWHYLQHIKKLSCIFNKFLNEMFARFHRCIHAPYAHATPFLASLSLPALPRPRFGVNGLGMSRATILESGVVICCESFELQPFKVDQLFRGVFKRSSNRNTYRNEAFKDIFSYRGYSLLIWTIWRLKSVELPSPAQVKM